MAASASSSRSSRGMHQFSMFCYGDLVKRARPGEYIASAMFRCAGYDWAFLYFPVGDGILNKDQGRVSISITLLKNRDIHVEEAKGTFTLHINGDKEKRFDIHIAPGATNSWWYSMASKDVPVEDDRVTITFTVELCREKGSPDGAAGQDLAVIVPPPNMSQHLLQFLESKEGADVTFHVEHREFQAHKLLLAMRSPVFRAEFFGSMKEAATRTVRILDMKADAFEAILRFVYSDETPPDVHRLLHRDHGADKARLVGRVRDLLAAADRFGLERMRLMCEKALCEAVDEENAAAALSLADQHHCQKLKAFCINYISSAPGVLKDVMATEAFQDLKERCPSVLVELLDKLATKAGPVVINLLPENKGN